MHTIDVLKLAPLADYREQRQHIFPSRSSLDWYLRKNRSGLVENGALLLVTGRWFVNADRFDAYLLDAGASAARAQAALGEKVMDHPNSTSMDNNDRDNIEAAHTQVQVGRLQA